MSGVPIAGGRGRLLLSSPGQPAENMAIDAAILAAAQVASGPTLRLYTWAQPTLSLGYFQASEDREQHAPSAALPVVRRTTGGGAIVHDLELTYSLVIPAARHSHGADPVIYRAVHDAIAQCLADWGIHAVRFADSGHSAAAGEPFLCFERRTAEDLVVGRHKVLGSAQRRGSGGLLQHGSLLLAASAVAPQLQGLSELSGRSIRSEELVEPICEKLAAVFDVQWMAGEVSAREQAFAQSVEVEKFASPTWTQRR